MPGFVATVATLISGVMMFRPFQSSSATSAYPEMRCTCRVGAHSGEPPSSPRKPLASEIPPTIRMNTFAHGCAHSTALRKVLQPILRQPPTSRFQATRPRSPLVECVGEGFKPSLGMRSSTGSSSLPRSAFTHTSITIQATRPRSPFVEVVGEGFKPSLGMRSSTGSSSPPPPGSAFTHTSITIQATRPWSPLVEGVGEGFKPSLGMRSNLGSHLLPRSAYSCTSITHAHAEIKGLGSSVGRRTSSLPRWWTWLISAIRASNYPLKGGRRACPESLEGVRVRRVEAGAEQPCNDSLVDTRTGRRAGHTRRPVPCRGYSRTALTYANPPHSSPSRRWAPMENILAAHRPIRYPFPRKCVLAYC